MNHKVQKQPPRCYVRKGVLRNFAKFTGKHLSQSLFFNKVAGLSLATILKKRVFMLRKSNGWKKSPASF